MPTISYLERRRELETYFDRTAVEAWSRLTSDAPLGRIRQTVRAGRDMVRRTLLGWLPADLAGARVLDAGCGTGTLAVEIAKRGADVLAIDLSPTLIDLARKRSLQERPDGNIDFQVGDMLMRALGRFDYVIAMDSLIHYRAQDMVKALGDLVPRSERALLFTFVPRTPALTLMHMIGRTFPRKDRAPAIEPVSATGLAILIEGEPTLAEWDQARSHRITHGFYTSQAQELVPA
jgi:magnesium-protoporphyrin O-methyltransferase